MFARSTVLLAPAIITLTCSGCHEFGEAFGNALGYATPHVIVDTLVGAPVHVHGPGCGHVYVGGIWTVDHHHYHHHVCTHACHDHYWNGTSVVYVDGHVHGPGCGHYWSGTYWLDAHISGHVDINVHVDGDITDHYFEGHVCTHTCQNHYWAHGHYVMVAGHTHGLHCGHHWNGEHWVLASVEP